MQLSLEGKSALVSGGSYGIGKSIALELAREGCSVAIFARRQDLVDKTIKELTAFGAEALGITADALDDKSLEKVKKIIEKKWESVDILINNVGGGGRWGSEIYENTSMNVWKEVYKKNAEAAVNFTMWAVGGMRKRKWGRIITISSRFGKEAGGRPWFNMAKAAQISLMKTLASTPYLAKDGITFNTVAPGAIMIPGTGWADLQEKNSTKFKKIIKEMPLGRLGTPEEVAYAVVFLCSPRASLINGACLVVDGGESRAF